MNLYNFAVNGNAVPPKFNVHKFQRPTSGPGDTSPKERMAIGGALSRVPAGSCSVPFAPMALPPNRPLLYASEPQLFHVPLYEPQDPSGFPIRQRTCRLAMVIEFDVDGTFGPTDFAINFTTAHPDGNATFVYRPGGRMTLASVSRRTDDRGTPLDRRTALCAAQLRCDEPLVPELPEDDDVIVMKLINSEDEEDEEDEPLAVPLEPPANNKRPHIVYYDPGDADDEEKVLCSQPERKRRKVAKSEEKKEE